jgi:hypothetical protein
VLDAKIFLQSVIDGNVDFWDEAFADQLLAVGENHPELKEMFEQAAQVYSDWAIKKAKEALANMAEENEMRDGDEIAQDYSLDNDDLQSISDAQLLEKACSLSAYEHIHDVDGIDNLKNEIDQAYARCLESDNPLLVSLAERALGFCTKMQKIVQKVADNAWYEASPPTADEMRDAFIDRMMRGAYHPTAVMEGLYRALMLDEDGKPMNLWELRGDLESILTYWRQMMDWSRVIVHDSAEVGYAEAVNNQFEKFFKGISDDDSQLNPNLSNELRDWMMFMMYKKETPRDATSHPEDFHYWE